MWIRIHRATFGTISTVRDHSRGTVSAPYAAVAKKHVRAKKKKDSKSTVQYLCYSKDVAVLFVVIARMLLFYLFLK